MSDYLQPDFYRFNEDSIRLVRFVTQKIKNTTSILDLGAGSGIIGLELSRFYGNVKVSFVELQIDFLKVLEENISRFLPSNCSHRVFITSFKEFSFEHKFETIVVNPPYYLPQKGQPSKDSRRHLARTFVQDNWKELLLCIERNLSQEGKGFIVIKNDRTIIDEILKSKVGNLKTVMNGFGDIVILELTI